MTSPKELAEYTGFTENEVRNLCLKYNLDFPEAQKWYDGYKLKNVPHMYNPKSVVDLAEHTIPQLLDRHGDIRSAEGLHEYEFRRSEGLYY